MPSLPTVLADASEALLLYDPTSATVLDANRRALELLQLPPSAR
ncbi:MAG: hypothetical protein U1F42_06850 [Candidatus Competibacteraceae bacterium]